MSRLVCFIGEQGDHPITIAANCIIAVQCCGDGTCIVTDANGFDWECAEPHNTVVARWLEGLRAFG